MRAKSVNENIEFQRGLYPKKSLRIGKSRTPNVGEEIKIYNAMDDKYWTGLIEYVEDDILTVEIYGEAAGSYPVKFNDMFMEWMIDE